MPVEILREKLGLVVWEEDEGVARKLHFADVAKDEISE